ncbi:MAG: hypothetical protein AB7P08_01630 [Burkholderiales bacterium]
MARDLTRAAFAAAALCLCAGARGEERATAPLPDPTRPPAGFEESGGKAPATPAGPVLQSVLIAPGRQTAIISGRRVALGESYGEARLTRLTDAEAVLEGPGGRTVLRLAPAVKRSATAPSGDGEAVATPSPNAVPRDDRAPRPSPTRPGKTP